MNKTFNVGINTDNVKYVVQYHHCPSWMNPKAHLILERLMRKISRRSVIHTKNLIIELLTYGYTKDGVIVGIGWYIYTIIYGLLICGFNMRKIMSFMFEGYNLNLKIGVVSDKGHNILR